MPWWVPIYIVAAALIGWLMWCNRRTFRQRMTLLERTHELAVEDIDHLREWIWRYDALDTVSYGRHLLSLIVFLNPMRLYPDWMTEESER